jgi:CheY-like chemotaxis protein
MKVMIVDDNPTDLKLFGALVETGGHAAPTTDSAAAALQAARLEPPDVIVLDMHLPGIDGLQLVRQLRADSRTATIPIVAITAFSDEYGRQRALDAGCSEWLLKPIDTRKLATLLECVQQRA